MTIKIDKSLSVMHNMSRIDPCIYLGGQDGAAMSLDTLRSYGITHILNVTMKMGNHFDDKLTYLRIQIPDLKGYDISKHFRAANEFIIKVRLTGGKVLVHCRAGQSRSATLVIAHLMMFRKWSLLKAYCHVKECRPVIKPNPGFFNQLRKLELEINDGKENTMEVSDLSHGYANEMLATTPLDGGGGGGPRSRRAAERSARRRRSKRFLNREVNKMFGLKLKVDTSSDMIAKTI